MSKITEELRKLEKRRASKTDKPVWEGPSGKGENGGVTFSLLSRFLCCRERFRLYAVEGMKTADQFNHKVEYGNMWHVCEEALADGGLDPIRQLTAYCKELVTKYPTAVNEIDKWYNVCKVQFPEYVKYWSKHKDVLKRTPLLQEWVFDVPYKLPSGRTVRLRGKIDSVDSVSSQPGKCKKCYGHGWYYTNATKNYVGDKVPCEKCSGIWIQENKTKGDVRQEELVRQLTFDLQSMLYCVALTEAMSHKDPECVCLPDNFPSGTPFHGIRYNVIRRPLSGGKGTIVRKKATKNKPGETKEQYYQRLAEYIKEAPETYFFRWNVPITKNDIDRFKRQCLDPILEQLCDWWDWMFYEPVHPSNEKQYQGYVLRGDPFRPGEWDSDGRNFWSPQHFRFPFGVFNALVEGGSTDVDSYLDTGSEVGLRRVSSLFPELQ